MTFSVFRGPVRPGGGPYIPPNNNFINCASSLQRGGYPGLEKVLGSALETMKSLDRVKNHDISRIFYLNDTFRYIFLIKERTAYIIL